jgi:hypothetical protein
MTLNLVKTYIPHYASDFQRPTPKVGFDLAEPILIILASNEEIKHTTEPHNTRVKST